MGLISRVLSMNLTQARAGNSTVSSEFTDRDIENYYLSIISDCLKRMMMPAEDIEIIVRRARANRYGLCSFSAYVRILKWHPVMTPVLLQNISVIDGRIRKVIEASVILEQTHFAGLWFQVSSHAEGSPTSLLGLPVELVHQPGGFEPGAVQPGH